MSRSNGNDRLSDLELCRLALMRAACFKGAGDAFEEARERGRARGYRRDHLIAFPAAASAPDLAWLWNAGLFGDTPDMQRRLVLMGGPGPVAPPLPSLAANPGGAS